MVLFLNQQWLLDSSIKIYLCGPCYKTLKSRIRKEEEDNRWISVDELNYKNNFVICYKTLK